MPQKTRVRMIDIAREAGVSRVAVGAVLTGAGNGKIGISKEVADKIQEIARKYHYYPNPVARMLNGKSGKVIGVLMDSMVPAVSFRLLEGLEREAAKKGYTIQIAEAHNDSRRLYDSYRIMKLHCVDGVICISHHYSDEDFAETERFFSGVNDIVFVGGPVYAGHVHVSGDIEYGIRESAELLVSHNRKKVALLLHSLDCHSQIQRKNGFLSVFPDGGDRVFTLSEHELSEEEQAAAVKRFIKDVFIPGKFDGLLAVDDLTALKAIAFLQAHGIRIPQDVEIIGSDNDKFSEWLSPSLSTLDHSIGEIAQKTMEVLLQKIRNPEKVPEGQIEIRPTLIQRETTGRKMPKNTVESVNTKKGG